MRHARTEALDRLEPLLMALRKIEGLTERGRGTFYRKSRAVLHFHEDPSGLHADLRLTGEDFERFRVEEEAEQAFLLQQIGPAIGI
jgi:hypothetical protein